MAGFGLPVVRCAAMHYDELSGLTDFSPLAYTHLSAISGNALVRILSGAGIAAAKLGVAWRRRVSRGG